MISIFAPRVDFVKCKDGVVKEVPHVTEGRKNFDKFYVNYKIKEFFKPIEGDPDGACTRTEKVVEDKVDIVQLINSQADEVGLDNMLKKFELTGDLSALPQPVEATEEIVDLTKLPEDHADYMKYINRLAGEFYSLPKELRKDMTLEEFVEKVSDGDVEAYINSLKPKEEDKEKEKDGDK